MMHRDGAAAVPSARPGYPARAAASAIPAMPLSLHRWRAEDAHRRRQSGENTPSDAAARGEPPLAVQTVDANIRLAVPPAQRAHPDTAGERAALKRAAQAPA